MMSIVSEGIVQTKIGHFLLELFHAANADQVPVQFRSNMRCEQQFTAVQAELLHEFLVTL